MYHIKICGVPYSVETIERTREEDYFGHSKVDGVLYGEIRYSQRSIRIRKSCVEQELRTTIHEVLHGIIHSLSIKALMVDGAHNEEVIDTLSAGLAEALESVNIPRLDVNLIDSKLSST